MEKRKVLRSERLILRNIEVADANAVFLYRSLPEVARFQYWEPYTMEDAQDFVMRCCGDVFGTEGVWVGLAVVLAETGELIGDCAMRFEANMTEVGLNISPKYQKKGFAKEVLQCLIDYAFEAGMTKMVCGITDVENVASVKLMESVEMRRDVNFHEKVMCKGIWSVEYRYILERF